MLGAGAATSNDAVNPQTAFRLSYTLNNVLPGTLNVGISAGQLYNVPTKITSFTSTQRNEVRTQGSSTITTLMATVGYGVSVDVLSVSVLGSFGGANAAYRQYMAYDLPPNFVDPGAYYYSTLAAPAWTYGVALQADVHLSDEWSVSVAGGRDWFTSEIVTANNVPYGAPSYKATFSNGALYVHAGLSYRIKHTERSGKVEGNSSDSLAGEQDRWFMNAIVCSVHPFTDVPYNQFNPGLAIQWRDRSQGITGFAEGGAYQFSQSDRAMYAGAGALFPLGTEWVKLGIIGGVLTLHDGGSTRFYPALSPRLTIDSPWLSLTALLIPAGETTAVGFVIGLPLVK